MKSSKLLQRSASPSRLLAFGVLLAAALALWTRLPASQDELRLAQGGRALRQALVERARLGDLPFGPGTPPVWTLGRASDATASAGSGDSDSTTVSSAYRSSLEAARASFDQISSASAVRLAPVLRLKGITLGALGQYPEAEQALQAAHAAQPDDAFAALALGNVLDAQGQREDALAAWRPSNAQRTISYQLYRRGTALSNSIENNAGDEANQASSIRSGSLRSRGEQMMLLAVEIDPTNADALHALGGFYWGEDQRKATEYYRAALAAGELKPFYRFIAQARIATFEGRLEDAAAAYAEAVRLQPQHFEANHFLGVVLSRLGRTTEALTYLDRAASLSPNAFAPMMEKAQIYMNQHRYQEAIAVLRQATAQHSNRPGAFELLAQAYAATGDVDQAAIAWQRAIDLSPNNAWYYVRLGDVWQQAGNTEKAVAAYRQALELDPNNGRAAGELKRLGG